MKKILMIIDPQVDFIAGSLPVAGADAAMDSLSVYVREHGHSYDNIIVTADRHPFDHCSFKEYGGEWPRHCVHDSVGAAVWPALMEALYSVGDRCVFLYKGEKADVEEYSVFKNEADSLIIQKLVRDNDISRIDVAGIAGDVCVADSIEDGAKLFGYSMFNVLPQYTASIDGGKRIEAVRKQSQGG